MNLLVLTTLPHYLAITAVDSKDITYKFIIFTSTSLSVIWHSTNEQNMIIMFLDYFFALTWFLYEVDKTFHNDELLTRTILLNFLIFYMNMHIKYNDSYIINHSFWHLLSALKSYYLARSSYNVEGPQDNY